MSINPALFQLAARRVSRQFGNGEKRAFQPPGGGGADPAAMAAGGAPPADPAAAGGGMAPPMMDPNMMGAAMGGAGVPPMMDPSMAMGGGMGMMGGMMPGQKVKPEQWMQQLDYRLYNLQQQFTAVLNALGVEIPPGALITPPGMPMAPQPEQAMPGGPMDPSQQSGGQGGDSAINPVEPMPGASPELAQGKTAAAELPTGVRDFLKEARANAPEGWNVVMVKTGATGEGYRGDVDKDPPPSKSAPPQPLRGPHPGKTPSLTGPPTAGGSKDPKSRTDADDEMGPANEAKAAQDFGMSLAADLRNADSIGVPADAPSPQYPVTTNAAAMAAMFRSRAQTGS
jgi:hypothetical protein